MIIARTDVTFIAAIDCCMEHVSMEQLMSLSPTASENAGHNSAVSRPAQAEFVSESARLKSLEHGHVDQGQSAQADLCLSV